MILLRERRPISLPRNNDFAEAAYTSAMGGAWKPFVFLISLLSAWSAAGVSRPRGFVFNGVSNRFITPNGDGRNDNVAFRFSNPRDSAGAIKIYDVRGHAVASLPINPGDVSETWDAKAGGRAVDSGVYVYVIEIEGGVASGAVVVVR